jgi:hypothetical protein
MRRREEQGHRRHPDPQGGVFRSGRGHVQIRQGTCPDPQGGVVRFTLIGAMKRGSTRTRRRGGFGALHVARNRRLIPRQEGWHVPARLARRPLAIPLGSNFHAPLISYFFWSLGANYRGVNVLVLFGLLALWCGSGWVGLLPRSSAIV